MGERPGTVSLTASRNFPVWGEHLSVTSATGGSDTKPETADSQSRMPAAISVQNFSYGVISQTTPTPCEPPVEAVPYRLPLVSNTTLLFGFPPSLPPVKSWRSV